ncbi:hypothetical protein [Paucidesulfovibrio gracilis]|uniref:hypothetical protein n=1 Tax=Paucidesulfovibrio gracilis TaxID=47158 RepID=UPI00117D3867|nr:hypothetical protein [Paucidesulfovibrio gracilis]
MSTGLISGSLLEECQICIFVFKFSCFEQANNTFLLLLAYPSLHFFTKLKTSIKPISATHFSEKILKARNTNLLRQSSPMRGSLWSRADACSLPTERQSPCQKPGRPENQPHKAPLVPGSQAGGSRNYAKKRDGKNAVPKKAEKKRRRK